MRRRRHQSGQAALVAVVGLVILAIGMYTSYNLSRAVYEKIQLQDAADATAYSLATLEARTLNFIAFTNRAQVANYVQMMEAQSLLSNMTAIEGTTGYAGDVLICLGKWMKWMGSLLPIFSWMESIGAIVETVGRGLEGTSEVATTILTEMEVFVPNYIKLQNTKNWAMLAVAALYVATTVMQLGDGGSAIVAANDPDARLTPISYVLNGVNAVSFATTVDWTGLVGMARGTDSADARAATRVMTEIANASRYSAALEGNPSLIVSRELFDVLGGAFSSLGGVDTSGRGGGQVAGFISKILNILGGKQIGTTKLLQTDGSKMEDLDQTGMHEPEKSDLAAAGAIVAKDLVGFTRALPLGGKKLAAMGFFSVSSGAEQSRHCRYVKPSGGTGAGAYGGSNGATALVRMGILLTRPLGKNYGFEEKNCKSEGDEKHAWSTLIGFSGMTPYFPFASKISGIEAEKSSFNQPDVWVWLNKLPEGMALGGPGDLNFELKHGRYSGKLDARIGEDGVFDSGALRGINVLARAQVYYHRPGAWQEPPNFFNPYWGARLAPKNVAIKRLADSLGLGGLFAQVVADNVWMH